MVCLYIPMFYKRTKSFVCIVKDKIRGRIEEDKFGLAPES